MMKIFVSALTGRSIALDLQPSSTVKDAKALLEEIERIPIHKQRLIFDGKQLEDERKLLEYNIRNDAKLHFVLKLRGGGLPMRTVEISNIHFKNQIYSQSFLFQKDKAVREEIRNVLDKLHLSGTENDYVLVVVNGHGETTLNNWINIGEYFDLLTMVERIELRLVNPPPEEDELEDNLNLRRDVPN